MSNSTLYDTDFYAWALAQADALRQRRTGANNIDYDNLAEEVEDMGRSELHAARSYVRNIVAHLLKLHYSPRREPANHWRAEIVVWRQDLEDRLTPTLRKRVPAQLDALYKAAREVAALELAQDDPAIAAKLPAQCPYTWEQIAEREPPWWPDGPAP